MSMRTYLKEGAVKWCILEEGVIRKAVKYQFNMFMGFHSFVSTGLVS